MTGVPETGLAGYGLYFPEDVEDAAQAAARSGLSVEDVLALGLERKFKPGPDDQPVAMAVKAARSALDSTPDASREEVDAIIWTGEEYKDYIAQTASIRLQEEIGCANAFAFDLVGQGATLLTGFRAARDLMIGDGAVNTVLLAGGTRNVDLVNYRNPDTRFLLPYSASGAAVILKKNLGRNRLDGLAFRVDSEMADEVFVPGGGSDVPFSEDNLDSDLMFFQAPNPEVLKKYLAEKWIPGLAATVREALAGRRPDCLAVRHLAPAQRAELLQELSLDPRRSPALNRFGHHGANDTLISLDLALSQGMIVPGSTVALCSGGIGFMYGAAVLTWGPTQPGRGAR